MQRTLTRPPRTAAPRARRAVRPHPDPPHRRAVRPAAASSDQDYAALKTVKVLRPDDGVAVDLLSTFKAGPGERTILVALTHCADLAPQEFVPKLVARAPAWAAAGVQLRMVTLGSAANAAALADVVRAPPGTLFADPTAATHDALRLSRGYDPQLPLGIGKVSPYARLVAMLAGVGSPGTMREVARGYVGDRSAPPVFAGASPFDVLGRGYQRPMELATLRLQSMITSLSRWSELAPDDAELLTRLGGAVVLRGRDTAFKHVDAGILRVADVRELERAAGVEPALPEGRGA